MKRLLALFCFVGAVAVPGLAFAQVPAAVPIQGILTDTANQPVDGNVAVTFTLYDGSGTQLFQEVDSVNVDNGFFSVELGAGTNPLDLTIFRDNTDVELGIQVGSDSEMTPRMKFGTVPYAALAQYAQNAQNAQSVGGQTPADLDAKYVGAGQPNSVDSSMIVDGSVDTVDVANAVPLYQVTSIYCEEEKGTLMTRPSCHARQNGSSSCPACSTGAKVLKCDGSCGCSLVTFCVLGQPCDPRRDIPVCANQPIAAYGLAP